ncbi:MAG: hypothetical protein ACRECQ_13570 [Burkholderiaceae bacterium]
MAPAIGVSIPLPSNAKALMLDAKLLDASPTLETLISARTNSQADLPSVESLTIAVAALRRCHAFITHLSRFSNSAIRREHLDEPAQSPETWHSRTSPRNDDASV